MKFEPLQVGLYTGLLLAVVHAVWALMVFLGWAQPFMTFVLGLHFLSNPYIFKQFVLGNAVELVIFVFVFWFILGYLATICWNKMQKGR